MFENDFFWRRFRVDKLSSHGQSVYNDEKREYSPTAASLSYNPKTEDGFSVYSQDMLFGYGLDEVDVIKPVDYEDTSNKIFGIFKFPSNKAKEIEPLLAYTHDIDLKDQLEYRGNSHLLMTINTEGHKQQKIRWADFRNALLENDITILDINQPIGANQLFEMFLELPR